MSQPDIQLICNLSGLGLVVSAMRQAPIRIRTHRLHTPAHRGANLAVNAESNARLKKSYAVPTELSGSQLGIEWCTSGQIFNNWTIACHNTDLCEDCCRSLWRSVVTVNRAKQIVYNLLLKHLPWHESGLMDPGKQSIKLHNTVTFQMLHHVIKFGEKCQNWQTLVISSYKVIRSNNKFLTRYSENFNFQKCLFFFTFFKMWHKQTFFFFLFWGGFSFKFIGGGGGKYVLIMLHACVTQLMAWCYMSFFRKCYIDKSTWL